MGVLDTSVRAHGPLLQLIEAIHSRPESRLLSRGALARGNGDAGTWLADFFEQRFWPIGQAFRTDFYIWCCFLCIQVSFGNWETKETYFDQKASEPFWNIDISNVAHSTLASFLTIATVFLFLSNSVGVQQLPKKPSDFNKRSETEVKS